MIVLVVISRRWCSISLMASMTPPMPWRGSPHETPLGYWASCDHPAAVHRRAVDGTGERAGSGCIGSDGVGVALANELVGLRGNLDEGDPHTRPGSYLNSFYELQPLPYPGGYGYPESGQAIIMLPTVSSSGCSSMASRWTCATGSCAPRTNARLAGRDAAPPSGMGVPRGEGGAGRLGADGVADPTSRGRDQLRGPPAPSAQPVRGPPRVLKTLDRLAAVLYELSDVAEPERRRALRAGMK